MRLRDRRVQMTYPVRLTCQIIGYPPPEIVWHKDNEPITFGGKTKLYQKNEQAINWKFCVRREIQLVHF
jgi:hypothetical protein